MHLMHKNSEIQKFYKQQRIAFIFVEGLSYSQQSNQQWNRRI